MCLGRYIQPQGLRCTLVTHTALFQEAPPELWALGVNLGASMEPLQKCKAAHSCQLSWVLLEALVVSKSYLFSSRDLSCHVD